VNDVSTPLFLPAGDAAAWAAWVDDRAASDLAETRRLAGVLVSGGVRTPADVMSTWNDLNLALRNAFAVSSLMANVHPDEDVRSRAEQAEQDASRLQTELELDRPLFDVLGALDPDALDDDGRRVHSLTLRDFRRAGVDRDDAVRDRLRDLAERRTAVEQEFSKNIRDGARSVRVPAEALEGLPEDYVEAHPPGDDGLVEVTTDYPDYVPFMTFCHDRDARAALTVAFQNRAYPENDALLRELLALRREYARLLGYDGWPSYDAEVKMIASGPAIPEFIDRIAEASEAAAQRDIAVLLRRLQQDHPGAAVVDSVDKTFYTEVLRREEFQVDSHEVRRYLDFTKVRRGLLEVTGRLFDVEYAEVTDSSTWHADVTTYDVMRGGERLGRIHLDLHPRAGKYGHAAQFELAAGVAGRQLAGGVLVCNFSRTLMEHSHVVTLFHEFGHLVHHVLAGGHRWARFSGVATEWDFVEAPSQMLEEWAWDPDVLASFATDEQGQAIPRELVTAMRAASEFGKGPHARTQMFYAALSYYFHQDVPEDLTAVMRELQDRYDVFGHVPGTHFHASFGHLQGYGSGYYTYMWSLVIAKDLFSAFDSDDMFDTAVAHRYRDRVLAQGGRRDAADLVADFLGRPYDFTAFQRWLDRSPGSEVSG
jgi:thimet oligopeptidase